MSGHVVVHSAESLYLCRSGQTEVKLNTFLISERKRFKLKAMLSVLLLEVVQLLSLCDGWGWQIKPETKTAFVV